MKRAPEAYQRSLTTNGGLNPFGEPNLRLVWGGESLKRKSCPDQHFGPGFDCWCLVLWRSPEEFGPPELWPEDLGAYPSRGLYMIVQAFQYSGVRSELDTPILNPDKLALIAKTIMENLDLTMETREKILRMHMEKDHQKVLDQIEAACRDAWPLGDALSYAGQKNCSSAVQQKVEQIEKYYKMHGLARIQSFKPGFHVRACPEKMMTVDPA